MSEHDIVAVDHVHLKIYAERQPPDQFNPALDQVNRRIDEVRAHFAGI